MLPIVRFYADWADAAMCEDVDDDAVSALKEQVMQISRTSFMPTPVGPVTSAPSDPGEDWSALRQVVLDMEKRKEEDEVDYSEAKAGSGQAGAAEAEEEEAKNPAGSGQA